MIRILSDDECREWVIANIATGFTPQELDSEFPSCLTYQTPTDTGRKTALARAVTASLDGSKFGLLWITAWGIFPSSENMALFDGYRKSLGENRPIHSAPGHMFNDADIPEVECLLDLVLYFCWDASLFSGSRTYMIRASHDEWVSIRAKSDSHLRSLRETLDRLKLARI